MITHQTLMTRVARQLVAQTGWHTDCTELMADGDLAEVRLVGLDAATIVDLAHAIARDGVPA